MIYKVKKMVRTVFNAVSLKRKQNILFAEEFQGGGVLIEK